VDRGCKHHNLQSKLCHYDTFHLMRVMVRIVYIVKYELTLFPKKETASKTYKVCIMDRGCKHHNLQSKLCHYNTFHLMCVVVRIVYIVKNKLTLFPK
jgi:hypothetical protein